MRRAERRKSGRNASGYPTPDGKREVSAVRIEALGAGPPQAVANPECLAVAA